MGDYDQSPRRIPSNNDDDLNTATRVAESLRIIELIDTVANPRCASNARNEAADVLRAMVDKSYVQFRISKAFTDHGIPNEALPGIKYPISNVHVCRTEPLDIQNIRIDLDKITENLVSGTNIDEAVQKLNEEVTKLEKLVDARSKAAKRESIRLDGAFGDLAELSFLLDFEQSQEEALGIPRDDSNEQIQRIAIEKIATESKFSALRAQAGLQEGDIEGAAHLIARINQYLEERARKMLDALLELK